MMCSFHIEETGDEYQLPMVPEIPEPTDIDGFDGPFPFDIREIGPTKRREDGTFAWTRRFWFRTTDPLPDDPALHAALLAYMSDMTGASFRPMSLGTWGTHTDTSLDHALWFHRPPSRRRVELLRSDGRRQRRWSFNDALDDVWR